ncbi:uncharacterized protein LOC135811977 [Sycon ciliatum]|uniref:uncharacterized protein LOC135811977 n=1 Tax=Sycon ciliatum TaxID=27933 RepID=UPI0031F659F4|eukprot:scpid63043/ scgid7073/ 
MPLIILLVALCAFSADGQSVSLSASSLPGSAPYTIYVAENVYVNSLRASGATTFLPACSVLSQAGPFIRLVNEDTNRTVAETGMFDNIGGNPPASAVVWNVTAFPVLTPELSGTYRCFTANDQSVDTYTIRVVTPATIYPLSAVTVVDYNSEYFNVTCTGTSFRPQNLSIVTDSLDAGVVTHSVMQSSPGQYTISATVTFRTNETVPMADQSFNFECVNMYPATACTPFDNTTVEQACRDIINSNATTATTVRVYDLTPCADISGYGGLEFPNGFTSRARGTVVSVACATGYVQNGTDITNTTCMAGQWSTLPNCVDTDECLTTCTDVNATCTNIAGSFTCTCGMGLTGTGLTPGSCVVDDGGSSGSSAQLASLLSIMLTLMGSMLFF